jgi:hypothetical protein
MRFSKRTFPKLPNRSLKLVTLVCILSPTARRENIDFFFLYSAESMMEDTVVMPHVPFASASAMRDCLSQVIYLQKEFSSSAFQARIRSEIATSIDNVQKENDNARAPAPASMPDPVHAPAPALAHAHAPAPGPAPAPAVIFINPDPSYVPISVFGLDCAPVPVFSPLLGHLPVHFSLPDHVFVPAPVPAPAIVASEPDDEPIQAPAPAPVLPHIVPAPDPALALAPAPALVSAAAAAHAPALDDEKQDVHDEKEVEVARDREQMREKSEAIRNAKKDVERKKALAEEVLEKMEMGKFKQMIQEQLGSFSYQPAELGRFLESKETNSIMCRWAKLIDLHVATDRKKFHSLPQYQQLLAHKSTYELRTWWEAGLLCCDEKQKESPLLFVLHILYAYYRGCILRSLIDNAGPGVAIDIEHMMLFSPYYDKVVSAVLSSILSLKSEPKVYVQFQEQKIEGAHRQPDERKQRIAPAPAAAASLHIDEVSEEERLEKGWLSQLALDTYTADLRKLQNPVQPYDRNHVFQQKEFGKLVMTEPFIYVRRTIIDPSCNDIEMKHELVGDAHSREGIDSGFECSDQYALQMRCIQAAGHVCTNINIPSEVDENEWIIVATVPGMGVGAFARKFIPKGTPVCIAHGLWQSKAKSEEEEKARKAKCLLENRTFMSYTIDDSRHLSDSVLNCTDLGNIVRFLNHACVSNIVSECMIDPRSLNSQCPSPSTIYFSAKVDIQPGDQLCWPYGYTDREHTPGGYCLCMQDGCCRTILNRAKSTHVHYRPIVLPREIPYWTCNQIRAQCLLDPKAGVGGDQCLDEEEGEDAEALSVNDMQGVVVDGEVRQPVQPVSLVDSNLINNVVDELSFLFDQRVILEGIIENIAMMTKLLACKLVGWMLGRGYCTLSTQSLFFEQLKTSVQSRLQTINKWRESTWENVRMLCREILSSTLTLTQKFPPVSEGRHKNVLPWIRKVLTVAGQSVSNAEHALALYSVNRRLLSEGIVTVDAYVDAILRLCKHGTIRADVDVEGIDALRYINLTRHNVLGCAHKGTLDELFSKLASRLTVLQVMQGRMGEQLCINAQRAVLRICSESSDHDKCDDIFSNVLITCYPVDLPKTDTHAFCQILFGKMNSVIHLSPSPVLEHFSVSSIRQRRRDMFPDTLPRSGNVEQLLSLFWPGDTSLSPAARVKFCDGDSGETMLQHVPPPPPPPRAPPLPLLPPPPPPPPLLLQAPMMSFRLAELEAPEMVGTLDDVMLKRLAHVSHEHQSLSFKSDSELFNSHLSNHLQYIVVFKTAYAGPMQMKALCTPTESAVARATAKGVEAAKRKLVNASIYRVKVVSDYDCDAQLAGMPYSFSIALWDGYMSKYDPAYNPMVDWKVRYAQENSKGMYGTELMKLRTLPVLANLASLYVHSASGSAHVEIDPLSIMDIRPCVQKSPKPGAMSLHDVCTWAAAVDGAGPGVVVVLKPSIVESLEDEHRILGNIVRISDMLTAERNLHLDVERGQYLTQPRLVDVNKLDEENEMFYKWMNAFEPLVVTKRTKEEEKKKKRKFVCEYKEVESDSDVPAPAAVVVSERRGKKRKAAAADREIRRSSQSASSSKRQKVSEMESRKVSGRGGVRGKRQQMQDSDHEDDAYHDVEDEADHDLDRDY